MRGGGWRGGNQILKFDKNLTLLSNFDNFVLPKQNAK
jgi:hypothetical protein